MLPARPTLRLAALLAGGTLSGCGATSGIVAVGPGTFLVSEMRAEALGGGARAREVVLAEAAAFCGQQGRSAVILDLRPGGDPRGYYWPTAFDATFQCAEATLAAPSPGRQ